MIVISLVFALSFDFVAMSSGGLFATGSQCDLSGTLRVRLKERNQLLQIAAVAGRTCRDLRGSYENLEVVPAG